ncbi:hypothetical protein H6F74_25780 [Trichocoleus sp. FACHB-90]|uniref:hypothetical protein n=1 Tax=Cyanophyceae TaxID=3028117 RepID=UPI001686E2DC|nr:hypothetical protein [Trichocoleus sp. FACHB-90]MBD1929621.1 hypothetical protein [Trichocoleus sp. FACHB-90]
MANIIDENKQLNLTWLSERSHNSTVPKIALIQTLMKRAGGTGCVASQRRLVLN